MCNFQCLQIDTVDQDTCKKKIEAIFPSPSAMKSDTNDKWNKGSYLKAFTTVQNQTSSLYQWQDNEDQVDLWSWCQENMKTVKWRNLRTKMVSARSRYPLTWINLLSSHWIQPEMVEASHQPTHKSTMHQSKQDRKKILYLTNNIRSQSHLTIQWICDMYFTNVYKVAMLWHDNGDVRIAVQMIVHSYLNKANFVRWQSRVQLLDKCPRICSM